MNLLIAGLVCQLEIVNAPHWEKFLKEKYQLYLVSEKTAPDFRLKIIPGRRRNFLLAFTNSNFHQATLKTPLSLRRFRTFNFFFKSFVASAFLARGDCLLHASSLLVGHQGVLFAGKQGIGKSTIVQLAPAYQSLNDDFALIRKLKGRYYLFSSPFFETNHIRKTQMKIPIRTIYFLQQSAEVKTAEINDKTSIPKLASLVFTAIGLSRLSRQKSSWLMSQAWEAAGNLASKIPCRVLYFKKDDSFLKMIQK